MHFSSQARGCVTVSSVGRRWQKLLLTGTIIRFLPCLIGSLFFWRPFFLLREILPVTGTLSLRDTLLVRVALLLIGVLLIRGSLLLRGGLLGMALIAWLLLEYKDLRCSVFLFSSNGVEVFWGLLGKALTAWLLLEVKKKSGCGVYLFSSNGVDVFWGMPTAGREWRVDEVAVTSELRGEGVSKE